MTTNVYIDGFNLYYGSLKSRYPQLKWLDLQAFCENLLPGHNVNRIRYFTARVKSSPRDPGIALRQQTYLRALSTLPKVEIHFGRFVVRRQRMPLENAPPGSQSLAWVLRTEEKGTDVNLAAFLILDSCSNDFDEAVVISNDADLEIPVRMVRDIFNKRIGVVSPQHPRNRSSLLQNAASWTRPSITRINFSNSQLPQMITDANGAFYKPPNW